VAALAFLEGSLSMKMKLVASALLFLTVPLHASDEKAAALVNRYGGSMNREFNLDPKSPIVLIFLSKNAVQDGDLKDLADLKELRALDLTNAGITDQGMQHLKASTKLEWFTAYNTRLSDGTMKLFSGFKGMKKLYLSSTRVTDAGVKELLKLQQLEVLHLTGTDVTEKCLDDLIKMRSLRDLSIGSQHFTDAGIQKLAALTELRSLSISNSIHVTNEGIAKLRKALPNCKVNQAAESPKGPAPKDAAPERNRKTQSR
jgi:hypothetical protein